MHVFAFGISGMGSMFRRDLYFRKRSVIALVLLASAFLGACDTAATDTSGTSETIPVTETTIETSVTTETTETTAATTTTMESSETGEDETEDSGSEEGDSTEETTEESRDIGYGSYGFLIGDMRFHSQNDISMMIEPENAEVYDFGAKNRSSWIDTFYITKCFDMKAFDSSYRFLGYFNNETSVNFDGSVVIGNWKTPKGSSLDLYIAEITIISRNLVIKILPKYPDDHDYYNISINGRGYYASIEQLQMADFFLSYLQENPGKDPLEGYIESEDHTYYF